MERFIGKGLNAVVGLASRGQLGVEVNPDKRLVTKFRVFNRNRDQWSSGKSLHKGGSGAFLEGTGQSLDQRMSSGDELF